MKYFYSLILLVSFGFGTANGQLTIINGSTPSVLVDSLVNSNGAAYSNVVFQGVYGASSKYQAGLFSASGTVATNLGFSSGIVLCTGNTSDIPLSMSTYPGNFNFSSSGLTSTCSNGEVRQSGSCPTYINDADVLAGSQNYYNASILEFDFVPTASIVEFDYVFGSEEYDQDDGSFSINYNCSTYNDKFGFIISGPGISGGQGYSNDGKNIARLANGSEVSINSVNDGVVGSYGGSPSSLNCTGASSTWVLGVPSSEFNGPIYGIQFNGNTNVLTATQSGLTPGSTYHIKLIVTDVKDGAYDSGVFLKAASFGSPVVLPVQLAGFSAECKENFTELSWQTTSEINNDYFGVEKSVDGFTFFTIGNVNGSGNNNALNNYSFRDFELNSGVGYYRLKQVDFNGEYDYSKLVAIKKCEDDIYEISNVYYNSSKGIVIDYKTREPENVKISLFDVQGKMVRQIELVIGQNKNQVSVPVSLILENAIYLVRIVSNKKLDTKKIIVSN